MTAHLLFQHNKYAADQLPCLYTKGDNFVYDANNACRIAYRFCDLYGRMS